MSEPTRLPTPLAPSSKKLRDRRVEVNVSEPVNDPARPLARSRVYRTGRFATESAARRWAEGVRPVGHRASITRYAAVDGWQPHAVATLTDSGWA